MTGSGVMTIFVDKGLTGDPEITNTFEFCPIFGGSDKLGIPDLARMPLIKRWWTQQNARVIAFTFSELRRENQQRRKGV